MLNNKIQEILNDLKEDNSSGANEFINKALKIFNYQLEILSNQSEDITTIILELSKEIINSRPSMAPLINTIGYLVQNLESIAKQELLIRIEQFKQYKMKIEKKLDNIFQDFIAQKFRKDLKVMLISYSSTIIRLLKNLKGQNIELYIMESRPLLEGQLSAKILSANFPTHIIIDAATGKFMDQIDLVLVGIDSVLKDGSIINKIGTYPLAVMANEKGVEVYGVGESLKYNLRSHFGLSVEIEEKPIDEVFRPETTEKNIYVHNYYFEVTPPQYITGIISDLGILRPQNFVKSARRVIPISWFQKFLNNND
ncbi:MAG: translation initiation factor eIF-2B [Promethearchaeota archaeon]|nr:MAG: translation initiation factor eIF-2B [Candidatus Lokiarchaeota archaeon]